MGFDEKHKWKKAKAAWKETSHKLFALASPGGQSSEEGKRLSLVVRPDLPVPACCSEKKSHFPPRSPSRGKNLQGPTTPFKFC